MSKLDQILAIESENIYTGITLKQATKMAETLEKLLKTALDGYTRVAVNLSDLSEDGEEGYSFEIVYGPFSNTEMVYNIDYKQTVKNLKRNSKLRVADEKQEDLLWTLIIR